ncbi:MAG: hypothetical protein ABEJ31_09345 [Haloarculaceae archaeon]
MARPALHALLAVCLLTAGCSVLGPDHTRDERAEAALENATDALAATETYRFESNLSVSATADSRTKRIDARVTGVVDAAARAVRSNTTSDGESRRTYVLNRTVYRECVSPWDGWGVEDLDDDTEWASRTVAHRQLSLLETGSLYWNGTETIDGERVAVVTGEPTTDALADYRNERSQPLLGGASVDDAELRAWIDPDTGRLRRTRLHVTVSKGDNSAATTAVTTFGEYGEPVTIDLPDGARTNQHELGCPGD